MSKFDVVLTLITIVYGLMITDLLANLHKLIKSKKKVKWHWLPLVVAWYTFMIILKNWWDLTSLKNLSNWINIYSFIAYGHMLILFYLLVSAVLPDPAEGENINLKEYYFNNHRYYWGLMLLVVLISFSISLIAGFTRGVIPSPGTLIIIGIYIILNCLLIFSRKKWLHTAIIGLFIIQLIIEVISKGAIS